MEYAGYAAWAYKGVCTLIQEVIFCCSTLHLICNLVFLFVSWMRSQWVEINSQPTAFPKMCQALEQWTRYHIYVLLLFKIYSHCNQTVMLNFCCVEYMQYLLPFLALPQMLIVFVPHLEWQLHEEVSKMAGLMNWRHTLKTLSWRGFGFEWSSSHSASCSFPPSHWICR